MPTPRHQVRWTTSTIAWGAILLLFGASATSEGQSTSIVRGDDASCANCALLLSGPRDLRVPDSTAALFSPFTFAMDSRGQFYFNDPFGTLGVRVFGVDGKYVRTVGRRGQAPGEFLSVDAITFGTADTMHVYGNAHWIFDQRGRHVQSLSTPALMQVRGVLVLRDGASLFVGSINSPEAYGHPFHLMDRFGGIKKSFGLAKGRPSVGLWSGLRSVAPFGAGGFVSARTNSYEIEFWKGDGTLERVIRREASWFPDWTTWDSRTDRNPPPSRVMAIAVDDSGLIWTLIATADAQWRPSGDGAGEARISGTAQLTRGFDSIIEIIDPRTNRLVAHQRFPQFLTGMPRPGIVMENVEDPPGEVAVRVWRVSRPAP